MSTNLTSYLDFTSYGTTSAITPAAAYPEIGNNPVEATSSVNVAFVLPRANDQTSFLTGNWATRQTTLAQLEANGTLWTTYGAAPSDYQAVQGYLVSQGAALIGDANGAQGYISSPQSRTIWATLSPTAFNDIFGTRLLQPTPKGGMLFWNGDLALPSGVAGLWFDLPPQWDSPDPAFSNLAGNAAANQPQGPFSVGNSLSPNDLTNRYPSEIADAFYNYPLAGINAPTTTIGVIEPLIGDSGTTGSFIDGLNSYRLGAGIATPANYYLIANNGEDGSGNGGERSLDVGVLTSVNPASTLGLYVGSGVTSTANPAYSNTFTAYQAAFWDNVNQPPVVSSSFGVKAQPAPGSPFAYALEQLFIDAALANVTLVQANNDFGSSWGFFNGLANQTTALSSPFVLLVGGTSLTTLAAAPGDSTLTSSLYAKAMAGDMATLWLLIEGGLTQMPSAVPSGAGGLTTFLESVWNMFSLSGSVVNPALNSASAGDGGVDTSQQTPWYQSAFGLTPTSANPGNPTGRGAPDVAANAGGNTYYKTPVATMNATTGGVRGTSAAAPMWAALMSQIDTIFNDQGLPNLGFANDLLYIAAAIAPGSFNDIVFGNNVTSAWVSSQGDYTLTGFGYQAGPGYDLTTGLGTPNGTLLARAMTSVAHSQMWFGSSVPDLINPHSLDGWTSGASQALLVQSMSSFGANVQFNAGAGSVGFSNGASGAYAWTSQLAQQSLQPDFDPRLVRLFDKQAQGGLVLSSASLGDALSVSVNSSSAQALQGTLSSPFGFADFLTAGADVRVARPVAVAETAGGQNDQTAIARIRQDGVDSLILMFYRVDDFNGTINGIAPGSAGYQAAAQSRAYQLTTGGSSISGPGYGNYEQTGLRFVDAGDLVAMQLTDNGSGKTFSAFAQNNESVNGQYVGHLWNYGVNTWGWEDQLGGGDRDYNDLIVGLDFTSSAGHGWLS